MLRKNLGLSLVIVLAACAPVMQRTSDQTIQVLLVNDVYVGEPVENGMGGIARLTTLKKQLEANGPVRMMLAGDFLFPSLVSKWYKGSQMIDYLNTAGLDYATFGNHEFDDSRQTLVNRVHESRFKWTSANCMGADGSPIPGVSQWDTVTVSGVKLGIFGVTLLQSYPRWINCGDPDSAVHASIPKLRAAGAQIIVGLTHVARAQDSTFLANNPQIDFIVGGHEHTAQVVTLGNRFVVKADKNAQTAQLVKIRKRGAEWEKTHTLIRLDSTIPGDAAAAALVARWQDSLKRRLGPVRVIANSPTVLDVSNVPIRSRETDFGNYVADAVRAGTGADVAGMIGGSMRYDDEIPAGPITNWQIESIYLFPDETRIATFPLTGARLRQILEQSLSKGGQAWGGYLQLSGVQFSWNSTLPVGSRIVGDVRRSNGSVIGPADVVKFSVNAYTACDSGDGYSIPEAADACKERESGPRAAQLLMDYMQQQKTVTLPPIGRVNRIR